MAKASSVSIVVPTLNSGCYVDRLWSAFASQSVQPAEVLVVDSQSTDSSAALWSKVGARVVVIPREEFDHGGTRNLAANLARGEVLVFVTQDVEPASSVWLEELIRPILDGVADLTFSRQIAHPSASIIERVSRGFNYPDEAYGWSASDVDRLGFRAFFNSNASSAVKRSAFEEVNGFPSPCIISEDWRLTARMVAAGKSMMYCSESVVWHSHNYGIAEHFRRSFDQGVLLTEASAEFMGHTPRGLGVPYLARLLREMKSENELASIPYALSQVIARYLAFALGRRHDLLPKSWKRSMSLNRAYWTRQ